jgi:hypothetical protein
MNGAFSRQRQLEDPAALVRPWWLFVVALGLILISLGYVVLQRGLASNSAGGSSTVSTPAAEQIADELLQTTKGLQVTQQQAVDQLQVVQDQLVAQKAETKKLTEQVAILTESCRRCSSPLRRSLCRLLLRLGLRRQSHVTKDSHLVPAKRLMADANVPIRTFRLEAIG